jgi:hypothetical protein
MALCLTALSVLCPPDFGGRVSQRRLPEQVSYIPPVEVPPPVAGWAKTEVPVPVATAKQAPEPVRPPTQSRVATQSPPVVPPAPATNASVSLGGPSNGRALEPLGLDAALVGRTYSGSIDVNGFNLPLPPGKWAILANTRVGTPKAPGTGLFLAHIEHRYLVGGVRVFAVRSVDKPGAGFPLIRGCVSGSPRFNYVSMEAATPYDHQGCWTMFNYFTLPMQQWADRGAKIAPLDRVAAGDLAAKGVTYAQDLMDVQFNRTEKWGAMQADYLLSPDSEGIKSTDVVSFTDSDWYASNISRFPEKVAYVGRLKEWAQDFWPRFKSAFDQGQPAATEVATSPQNSALPVPDGFPDEAGKDCLAATLRQLTQSTIPGMTQSRLPSHGLWCFFDGTGSLHEVRMDLPYSGAVDGVRLGDSIEGVKVKLGEPATQRAFGTREAYIYNRGPDFERFDVEAGTVQSMFVGHWGHRDDVLGALKGLVTLALAMRVVVP